MQLIETFDALRPLASHEFEQIRDLAYRSFGLDLKESKRELVSARLRKLVQEGGHRSYREYYGHVLGDPTGQSLAAMIDALTTNHTAFLREPEHFRFLREHVAPPLATRSRVDIWSAACSTGEEVWTLLFLLNDCLAGRNIRVFGTDISNRVLARARDAVYPADRVAALPVTWLQRYFDHADLRGGRAYRVSRDVRSCAEFRRLNLVEPFQWNQTFPIVFCRNVMIYFDKRTQEKVVSGLSACLEPGGYLFVGHAESLAGVRHGLEYVRPAVYRKPASGRRA